MNRLAPLITRSPAPPMRPRWAPQPSFAAACWQPETASGAERFADDLKLFATVWLGGVIFFGTLIA